MLFTKKTFLLLTVAVALVLQPLGYVYGMDFQSNHCNMDQEQVDHSTMHSAMADSIKTPDQQGCCDVDCQCPTFGCANYSFTALSSFLCIDNLSSIIFYEHPSGFPKSSVSPLFKPPILASLG